MTRALILLAALLTSVGCDGARTLSPAQYDLGGRYTLNVEDTGGNSSLQVRSLGEGTEVTQELYDYSWGNGRRLKIVDGGLSVDGVSRGKLAPGDRVLVKANGEVLINGDVR